MNVTALALTLVAILALPAHAADPPHTARVAGGGQVQLQASSRTPAQWTAARPGVRALRPKTRSNLE